MSNHRNRYKSGSFTLNQDVGVDVYIQDIIDNLSDFGTEELKDLRDAIDQEVGDETFNNIFGANNLEDEQKVKILKDLFYKYTWEELEKIKKSL